jgi:hypothetical protein
VAESKDDQGANLETVFEPREEKRQSTLFGGEPFPFLTCLHRCNDTLHFFLPERCFDRVEIRKLQKKLLLRDVEGLA